MSSAFPSSRTSVSSFARTSLVLAVPAVLGGGCMKIYPDDELPDIVASWEDFDCREGTGDVRVAMRDFEGGVVSEVTVACSALLVRFEDVAREQYRVEGTLLDLDGEVYSRNQFEVDLRDGISERLSLYFDAFSNFRYAWTFESGTCATNGIEGVALDVAYLDSPTFEVIFVTGCQFAPAFWTLPEGHHRVRLRGRASFVTLALSPIVEVDITRDEVTDVGDLVLVPCGTECPE